MKGFWHIVDAVLASLIITGFLIVASQSFAVTTGASEDLSERAYGLLQGLDDQGILKTYVANNDASGLNARLAFYTRNHSIQICGYSGVCSGTIPDETDVWVGNYITAGKDNYQPSVIRLYLW